MQTRYHMPPDVRRHAIEIVRGYPRRLAAYREARYAILSGSSCPYVEYAYTVRQPNGKPKVERARQYFPHGSSVGDPTAAKALRLAALEDYIETKRMRAVEQALVCVGDDIPDDGVRQKLRRAILDSCNDGRNFSYTYCDLPIGKSTFYRRHEKFLHDIAGRTNFL